MKRNFSGKLSLEDTARYVGFSPTYFSKVFKDEMGVTFNSYLGGLRVERSKILLLYIIRTFFKKKKEQRWYNEAKTERDQNKRVQLAWIYWALMYFLNYAKPARANHCYN